MKTIIIKLYISELQYDTAAALRDVADNLAANDAAKLSALLNDHDPHAVTRHIKHAIALVHSVLRDNIHCETREADDIADLTRETFNDYDELRYTASSSSDSLVVLRLRVTDNFNNAETQHVAAIAHDLIVTSACARITDSVLQNAQNNAFYVKERDLTAQLREAMNARTRPTRTHASREKHDSTDLAYE